MLGPLLVELADEFNTSIAVAGQLAAATFITWGITAPLVGPISDTYGRRPVLLTGLLLMAVGVLGSAVGWSYSSLLAFRLVTGAGAAMLPALADSLPLTASKTGEGGRIHFQFELGWGRAGSAGDSLAGRRWGLAIALLRHRGPIAGRLGSDVVAATQTPTQSQPDRSSLPPLQGNRP